jgi:hypothetical protein
MKEVLTYSLRKFPSPLSTVDGQLVKTPKAKLLHILEGRVEDSAIHQLPPNNALIVDGMALIQTIKRIPETFGALVKVKLIVFCHQQQVQSQQGLISCATHILM